MPFVRAMSRTREYANSGLTTVHFTKNPSGLMEIHAGDISAAILGCLGNIDNDPSVPDISMKITIGTRDLAGVVTEVTGETTLVNDGQLEASFDPDGTGILAMGATDLSNVIEEETERADGDSSVCALFFGVSMKWSSDVV